ncbi:hypothetical protein Nepgr_002515 [Nepenthes gracilis]|uniref:Uncharacterized protein n=1 Tax=Nepenthes gracilis TaxID=150966 RepID=A0AAD3P6Y5_NEPGR|nr:hypothetical protein Nepgr_002515 [Nepenthes gracilis]
MGYVNCRLFKLDHSIGQKDAAFSLIRRAFPHEPRASLSHPFSVFGPQFLPPPLVMDVTLGGKMNPTVVAEDVHAMKKLKSFVTLLVGAGTLKSEMESQPRVLEKDLRPRRPSILEIVVSTGQDQRPPKKNSIDEEAEEDDIVTDLTGELPAMGALCNRDAAWKAIWLRGS